MTKSRSVPRPAGQARAQLAERKAELLKALAHPARVTMFEALAGSEKTVGELAALLGAKDAITSRHLALMRSAGLVHARKAGLNVYYSIRMPCLLAMLSCLDDGVCGLAEEQGRMAALVRRRTGKRRTQGSSDA